MQSPEYISVAETKSRKKKPNEPSQLAQDSFDAFEPFINVFDCGILYDGSPVHAITKEDWNLFRRHKAGEKNLRYPNGTRFNAYLHVVRNIYSPTQAHEHIEWKETTYYTSGRNGLGLLYLDIDAHHAWQTDEYRAKAVLRKLFPFGYFRASKRGQNGYLKVRFTSISEFNQIVTRLEEQLKRLFLHLGIVCDIEVKGTITDKSKSGSLAKLPFNNTCPCNMRDETDSWNYPQLRLFKACPVVNVRRVMHLTERLQPQIDDERVRRSQERKEQHIEQEKAKNQSESRLLEKQQRIPNPQNNTQDGVAAGMPSQPASNPDAGQLIHRSSEAGKKKRVFVRLSEPGDCEDSAFIRNQKVLLPFVRAYYKKNRQFPGVADALSYLKENGLFSGQWEDRENQRAIRVGQILDYTEQTFDPDELGGEDNKPLSLSLGRYAWWVRQKFGSGINAKVVDVRRFDPVTMSAPVSNVWVPPQFIDTFLIVADVCLNGDPLDNNAVPTNRIKKLWAMVKDGASWNQRYFQIVRDKLDEMGVIHIFDRQHTAGKAWRWKAGREFPAESWKEHQRKLQDRIPRGEAEELPVDKNFIEKMRVHNTLYQIASGFGQAWPREPAVRPPPD